MKKLQFAVIGAQKSGTTSIRKHLRSHPKICVPEGEAPFFTRESLYESGWKNFADSFFSSCNQQASWGVVSPQYMGDLRAPKRLHAHNPELKLIAVLRDPIERARSHHRMAKRRKQEEQSFEKAALRLLSREQIDLSPPPPEPECYLEWSRYGRILEEYLQHFPRKQIFVAFTDDLGDRPEEIVKKVYSFVGVDEKYTPPSIGRRYHRSGPEKILTFFRRYLRKGLLGRFWRNKIKKENKEEIYDWVRMVLSFFPLYKIYEEKINKENERKLVNYFKRDIKVLKNKFDLEVPWSKYK